MNWKEFGIWGLLVSAQLHVPWDPSGNHVCNRSTRETEAGIAHESEANLGYSELCLPQETEKRASAPFIVRIWTFSWKLFSPI